MQPSYRIVADSAVRLWGLTCAERLARQLARLDVRELAGDLDALPEESSVVLLDGGHLYDQRVLEGLVGAAGCLVLGTSGSTDVVAAHVPAARASTALDVLRGEADPRSVAGVRVVRPEALATAFDERLRRFGPPTILRVTPENRRALEDRLFGDSYKGVTDFVTKFWWPRPARAVTRSCVRQGLSPNQVTGFGLLLVVLAGVLFARGSFGWGLVAAWLMTFLDTVDGKLARVTVASSRVGHVLDHGTDIVHPPLWYLAWGLGLATFEPVVPGLSLGVALTVIVAGYVLGRFAEGGYLLVARADMFVWRRFDSFFRLVTARRNPNLVLLTLSVVFTRPDLGLEALALWTGLTTLVLLVRLAMAVHYKATVGVPRSWLLDVDPEKDTSLAVRWFAPRPPRARQPSEVLVPAPRRAVALPGRGSDRGGDVRRVGVLSNPLSRRNRITGIDGLQEDLARHAEALHRVVSTPEEIAVALAEFEESGVNVIAINGGDGTVDAVLDVLLDRAPFEEFPLLAILPGGRTNMTARDVGARGGSPRRALGRLLAWAESGDGAVEVASRNVIRVDGAQGGQPRFGLFFSTAGIYQATVNCWSFRHQSRLPGMKTGLGTAVSVGTQLVGHCLGRERFEPSPIRVRLDDEDQGEREYLALFVTTLERMALGLRPFWGSTPGRLRFTAVDYEHRHLLRAVTGLVRGKPNGYPRPEHGYASHNADRIALELTSGCLLDGEPLQPTPSEPLHLSAEHTVRFVRP